MTTLTSTQYETVITTDRDVVRACQRLRHEVFTTEFGAAPHPSGLDTDEFDEVCEHLAVFSGGEVVGTYRLLPPGRTTRLYAQSEFDLDGVAPLRPHLVETGRSCVHPDHRSGGVINSMWAAMARYVVGHGYRYLAGCASVSLADGGTSAAATWALAQARHRPPDDLRVAPHRPWLPLPRTERAPSYAQVPPLLRGYLRLGAWVCGPPAHDADFAVADFFTVLAVDEINERYRRYFLGDDA
ncbi:GNAT family N-acetyltransferase [Amycolatopsis viridis]|uniref:Hemolysin n=1 Tax=Amycolatopsis viridis TaxID=185678 RepID=A0ABX0T0Z6_9PSEU|nr:GNAT family N-acyltransferase [Amycolatopsis viridis]NIH82909.1 putative hemolysin [Amycolatopsis viridis]